MDTNERASVVLSRMSQSALCDYGYQIATGTPQRAVRFVRGAKMTSVDALFDEVSAACQFPYYFGENWAAFAECLGDLSWLDCAEFILIIIDADKVLMSDPLDIPAFARAITNAAKGFTEQTDIPVDLRDEKIRRFDVFINMNSEAGGGVPRFAELIALNKVVVSTG